MSYIRDTAKLTLSRESVTKFLNEELMAYGTLSELRITSIEADEGDDTDFLTLFLEPKPPKKEAAK